MTVLRLLDDPDDLRRYVELKARLRDLAAEVKALEPSIYEALDAEPDRAAACGGFTLAPAVRRSYAYSDGVAELEALVREMKAAERSRGLAECVSATGYVVMKEDTAGADDRARAAAAEARTHRRAA